MARFYRITFAVIPDPSSIALLNFPIDMLRYDACHPASETDAAKIMRTMDLGSTQEPEEIRLAAYRHGWPKWMPTTAKWQSHGWKVKLETIEVAKD